MADPRSQFIAACRPASDLAAANGYPPFTSGLRTETPLNSAPYLFDLAGFRRSFGTSDRRRSIIDACETALGRLGDCGVTWRTVLIGGSFLRQGGSPSDLDGLVLYTIDAGEDDRALEALGHFAETTRDMPVDLALCPADADTVIVLKRSIFFSNLFGYDRERGTLVHGTVMLVPDRVEISA